MGYEQAMAQLPRVNDMLAEAADGYSKAYEEARQALSRCYQVMANEGARVAKLRAEADRLRQVVDRGPIDPRVMEPALVDSPTLTAGLRHGAAEDGKDLDAHQPVVRNMAELIGGLARVSGCTEEHKLAAAKLRSLWEVAQLGGAKAIDYSQARVDTSGGEDRTEILGADARRQYAVAVQHLGMLRSSVVERIVVHDASLRDVAASMGGNGGQARDRTKRTLFEGLNTLVEHFGVRSGAGASNKLRARKWNDGQGEFVVKTQRPVEH